ncbi:hypothetical protein L2E82_47090 [Cichorium intybus]|uniref:Uncharacterized protein n=1 Tax=Cichorium intybus TaxID=13427 RepID=A0ACB8YVI5_CICIN|nr:hypothetical protein L2E82_47090 [Cichorium intybus]
MGVCACSVCQFVLYFAFCFLYILFIYIFNLRVYYSLPCFVVLKVENRKLLLSRVLYKSVQKLCSKIGKTKKPKSWQPSDSGNKPLPSDHRSGVLPIRFFFFVLCDHHVQVE